MTSSFSQTHATFEEVLARDGMLTYRVRGVSMEPMLRQDRDLVTIRARCPHERFAENDVVLYYRQIDRRHTLHRIVGEASGGYIILGDNCANYECGIPYDDVLGVLVSFIRDGRSYEVSDPAYLAYVQKLRHQERWRISKKRVLAKVRGLSRIVFPRKKRGA